MENFTVADVTFGGLGIIFVDRFLAFHILILFYIWFR